ncbi:MAG: ABC transporter permease [Caldisericia bacterium]
MPLLKFRLEKRESVPNWFRIALPFIAIGISFIFSSIIILLAGKNPITSIYSIFYGALGTRLGIMETIVKVTPLILTGIAVSFAFTGKFWNIGAEGQLYAGALAATWAGISNFNLPSFLYILLLIIVGFIAGGLWALIPGYLKAKLKVDDVVTTLLMNYIILYLVTAVLEGPWRDPVTMWPQSIMISPNAEFPKLLQKTRVHFGLIIGLLSVFVVYIIIKHTKLGFNIRAIGANPNASNFLGINVTKTLIITSFISGGIAALAGVGEVAGLHYHLTENISPGYGYTGIVIAMLGGLNPFGVLFASFFFAIIITGAQYMSRATGVTSFIADVIQGITLLVLLAMLILYEYRIRRVE